MSASNSHRQLRVTEAQLCLWLPESEWHDQGELFARAGNQQAVNRINIAIYDHTNSFCNTVQRYAPAEDSAKVQEMLLRRIPMKARESDDVVMEIDANVAIVRDGPADLVNLGYALTDAQLTDG